jgi:hypothetical protein
MAWCAARADSSGAENKQPEKVASPAGDSGLSNQLKKDPKVAEKEAKLAAKRAEKEALRAEKNAKKAAAAKATGKTVPEREVRWRHERVCVQG